MNLSFGKLTCIYFGLKLNTIGCSVGTTCFRFDSRMEHFFMVLQVGSCSGPRFLCRYVILRHPEKLNCLRSRNEINQKRIAEEPEGKEKFTIDPADCVLTLSSW